METLKRSSTKIRTMLGKGDVDTCLLSGEFRDRAFEHDFRLWRHDATLAQYKIIGWLLVLAVAPFLWTAYQIFGPSTEYAILLTLRCLLLTATIACLWLAHRRKSYQSLERVGLIVVGLLLTTNAMTMHFTMIVGNLMVVQALMIVTVCYVIYPGRLIHIAPALLIFTAIFLFSILTKSQLAGTEGPGIVVWAFIANSVGYLSARQFNRFRRREYKSIRTAEENVQELEEARRSAEAARYEAEQANRAKSAMLANTSHELRTPLNAIIGFSEMIQRQMLGPVGDDRYQQYAADINGSGVHLLNLIDDLLDLSKIEAGATELRIEWVDPENLSNDVFRTMQNRAREKGVQLLNNIDPALSAVLADERSLRQILLNLLTNAVKFSPPDSIVRLASTIEPDGSAVLRITDHGPGFEPGDIERLLKPFQQAEADPTQPREGWGLGLALVTSLCHLNQIGFDLGNRDGGGAFAELRLPPGSVNLRENTTVLAATA